MKKSDILKSWTVLVVDDELDSREVACRILKFYGAQMSEAADGLQALARLETVKPNLIISDISMPNLDGWGLVYELNQDRATAVIPVIALTAHAIAGDRERAFAAGFHNYLTKPLTPATFLQDLLRVVMDVPELAVSGIEVGA